MIRINLLPVPKVRKQEALIIQAVGGVVCLGLVTAGCYFISESKRSQIVSINQEIGAKNRQIEELKAKVGEVERYKTQAQVLEQQLSVIRRLEKSRSGPVKLLDELTELTPRKLWISMFKETNKSLTVEGSADSGSVIADFMDALKTSKYFSEPQLTSVTAQEVGGAKVHKFIIIMQVRYDI
jgi:type IV pilus assembly protein PilN